MASDKFYPSLSTLIPVENIPLANTGFIQQGIDTIFKDLYYKELLIQKSADGSSTFYNLKIVSYNRIAIEIPGTNGLALVLNPDDADQEITSIPVSVGYNIEGLKYIKGFQLSNFSQNPIAFFNLFLQMLGLDSKQILTELIEVFLADAADPFGDFITKFNTLYDESIILIDDADPQIVIENLLEQIEDLDIDIFETVFELITEVVSNVDDILNNLKKLFSRILGEIELKKILELFIPQVFFSINNINIALEFPRSIFQPIDTDTGEIIADENVKTLLTFNVGSIGYSTQSGFEFTEESSFDFQKSDILNSGFTLELNDMKLDLSRTKNIPEATADGRPDDFIGVYIKDGIVGFPAFWQHNDGASTGELYVSNLLAGTGGLSGTVGLRGKITTTPDPDHAGQFLRETSALIKAKFGNFEVSLTAFSITFQQNSIISSDIAGTMKIAGFKDADGVDSVIGIKIHIGNNGEFSVVATESAGIVLKIPGVLEFDVTELAIGKKEDHYYIGVSGKLSFIATGVAALPKDIEIKKLVIWDTGKIELQGGMITLPKAVSLKIGPAKLSVTAIGMGSDERYKAGVLRKYNYFEFAAGLSIKPGGVDARGDGIKFYYSVDSGAFDCFIRIESINIDLIIPGSATAEDATVIIKGYLSMKAAVPPDTGTEYIGGVEFSMPKSGLGGSVAMRMNPDVPAFLIDVEIDLPSPIIIFSGVGIYGFRGLFGQKYLASRDLPDLLSAGVQADGDWYQYYKAKIAPDHKEGIQVSKFARKQGFSIGLGASIATAGDGGKLFSSKVFFLLSLPDLFMLQGQAGILRERIKITDTTDPPFSLLLVITKESFTADFGVDYKIPEDSGQILKLNALMEMAFFFKTPNAWYLNVGRDLPVEKRVTGRILDLFDVYSYLMFSGTGIKAGAGASFAKRYSAGPLTADLSAYIDIAGKINFKPVQIGASLSLGGNITLKAFKCRFQVTASLNLAGEVPHPFYISGDMRVCVHVLKKDRCISLAFKWVHDSTANSKEIPLFAPEKAVKAKNLLTKETYVLLPVGSFPSGVDIDSDDVCTVIINSVSIPLNDYTISLDSTIDMEFLKPITGLTNGEGISRIGGAIGGLENTDSVPKIKGSLEQINHSFTLDRLTIKHWRPTTSTWETFDIYDALSPLSIPGINIKKPDNPRYAYWQYDTDTNKINKLSILAMSPLEYTRSAVKYIPSEYLGVTSRDIFCPQPPKPPVCVGFNGELGKVFPQNKLNGQDDLMFRLIGADGDIQTVSNPFGFDNGLVLQPGSSMEIYFQKPTTMVELTMMMNTSGLTVSYYEQKFIPNTFSTFPKNLNQREVEKFFLIKTDTPSVGTLTEPLVYEDQNKPVSKVVIQAGVCNTGPVVCNTNEEATDLQSLFNALAQNDTFTNTALPGTEGAVDLKQVPYATIYNPRLASYKLTNTKHFYYTDPIPGSGEAVKAQYGLPVSYLSVAGGTAMYELCINGKTIATAAWQGDGLSTFTELMNSLNTGVSLGEVFWAVGQPQVWPFDGTTGYTAVIAGDVSNPTFVILAPSPGVTYNGNSPIFAKKNNYATNMLTLVQSPPETGSATLSISIGAPDQNTCKIDLNTVDGQAILYGEITTFANIRPDPAFYVSGLNYRFLVDITLPSGTVTIKGTSTCYPIASCMGGSLDNNKDVCTEVNNQITRLLQQVKDLTREKIVAEDICSVHSEGDCSAIGNIYCERATEIEAELITINEKIAVLSAYSSTQCSIINSGGGNGGGAGGSVFSNPCAAFIFKICRMYQTDYTYNNSILKHSEVANNVTAMLDGLSNSLQPIWRPNTVYAIEIATTDIVSGSHPSFLQSHKYLFRTAGPVGHFHEKRPEYRALSDDNKDNFRLRSLKDYIDYEKSYPNANGNIINAKPLFYGCPKLLLFFITPQVYTMYNNFDAFDGMPEVTSALKAVIKDPIEPDDAVTLTGDITWKINDNGIFTQDVITLNNLMNGPVCTSVYQITHAKGANIEIDLCGKIKPLKLYNAVYNAVYNGLERGVHTYSFQTSQYANFKEQVESYLIKDENDTIKKYAFYDIDKAFNAGVTTPAPTGIELAKVVIDDSEPQTIANDTLRDFAQPYDRLIDKAFELTAINPSVTTEFNMLMDTSTGNDTSGNVLGILIRNPEPFNDPKLKAVDLEKTIHVVTNSTGNTIDTNYKVIVSKDGSKAFIAHKNGNTDLNISAQTLYIRFQYLEFDGAAYTLNTPALNQVIVPVAVKAPLTNLIPADCGRTNVGLDEVLQATLVTGAIDYEFKIEHAATSFSASYTRGNADGKFPLVEVEGLMYNKTYTITVRPIISGRLTTFGSVCEVSTKVLSFVIVQPANIVQGESGLTRVEVQDISGNIIYEYQDDVTLISDGDAVVSNSGLVTIVNGIGTISITNDTVETLTLSLDDSESTALNVDSTSELTFTVARATQLVIEDPTDTVEGMQATVTVHARNSFPSEDIDTNFNGTVQLHMTGSATAADSGIVTIVNGTGTILVTDDEFETITLSLEDTGSTGFDVSSTQDIIFSLAPATHFVIANPADSVQGTAVTVTVTARNAFGYIDTNYQNDVTLVADGAATGAGLVSIVNGVGTKSINDTTVQTVNLSLSDTETTHLVVTSTQNVVFGIAPATQFVIINPADSVQGTAVTVTVQAQNAYGTIDTAYQNDVTLETDGAATGAGLVSIVNGVGTISINDTTAETVNLTLNNTEGTLLDTSSTQDIVFGIALATQFVIIDPADSVQGTAVDVTVQAQNAYGTVDPTYQDDVTLETDGAASGGGLVSIVNGVGTISINDTTAETVNLTLNNTESTLLDTSSTQDVVFAIAPATKFVILDPTDDTVGNTITVTVQAQNTYGTVDTAYQFDVTIATSGVNATGAGLVAIVNGIGSIGITNTVAETVNLTLIDTETTGRDVTSTQDVIWS